MQRERFKYGEKKYYLGGGGMEEEQVKETLEDEINLNLLIQTVKVVANNNSDKNDEYRKMYIKVKEPRILSQGEADYELSSIPDMSIDSILKAIRKLYGDYIFAHDEKMEEVIKKEILKLIAFLIWVLG